MSKQKKSQSEKDISLLGSSLFIWQKNLLERECQTMTESVQYFIANHKDLTKKFDSYIMLVGKIQNFSTLISQLNEGLEDFNEALCLLLGGHYKACLLVLRSHFEIVNVITRALKNNQPTDTFYTKRHKRGERKLKTKPLCIDKEWAKEIKKLYAELSKYTHATGKTKSHKTFNPLPQPSFEERSFKFCLNKINEVVDHTAGLLFVCINPKHWKKDLIVDIFGDRYKDVDLDEYEKEVIDYLYSKIDNTTVKKQINK